MQYNNYRLGKNLNIETHFNPHTLEEYTSNITVYDPWADALHVKHEYGIEISDKSYDELVGQFDAVILGVAHNEFKDKNLRELLKDHSVGVIYDVKGIVERNQIDGRL